VENPWGFVLGGATIKKLPEVANVRSGPTFQVFPLRADERFMQGILKGMGEGVFYARHY
jgi:hypothetical protein